MSEQAPLAIYDWWKTNSRWLENYIKADKNTSWREDDKIMVEAITELIEKAME